jgi:hypothetical protein
MQNPRNLWNPWLLLEVPKQLRAGIIRAMLQIGKQIRFLVAPKPVPIDHYSFIFTESTD